MAGLRGVRRTLGRWRRGAGLRRVALPALLAPALGGCVGDRIVIAGQRPPVLTELGSPDAGDGSDAGLVRPGIGVPAQCPGSPGERRQLLGCWPTRQVGSWQGYFLGIPRYETPDGASAEFPPGDVAMHLGNDGVGSFSVGVSPAPAVAGCDVRQDAACEGFGALLAGFEYGLEQVELEDAGERGVPRVAGEPPPHAGERMSFAIRLGQPWDAWCSSDAPCEGGPCPMARTGGPASAPREAELAARQVSCRCGPDRCVPEAPTLALVLTMSTDGRALRGGYLPRDPRLPEVGLELLRVDEP
ncbi:MAG TPA: hypothetical protein VNN80_00325 [Polyangiaceae bacterium]|nr:hypothetical protein [Polyangiaceae bacterium]